MTSLFRSYGWAVLVIWLAGGLSEGADGTSDPAVDASAHIDESLADCGLQAAINQVAKRGGGMVRIRHFRDKWLQRMTHDDRGRAKLRVRQRQRGPRLEDVPVRHYSSQQTTLVERRRRTGGRSDRLKLPCRANDDIAERNERARAK
jgi:hypothetical protein